MGVNHPNVALLDANEKASEKIPTSIFAKQLSEMNWPDATVYGPLSYDLALYEESVKHKAMENLPVAGHADILIVPHISQSQKLMMILNKKHLSPHVLIIFYLKS